jgi:hypothetical protein
MTPLSNVIIQVLARTVVAWHDLAWGRRLGPSPLVIQRVLSGDDACRGCRHGRGRGFQTWRTPAWLTTSHGTTLSGARWDLHLTTLS